MDPMLFHGNEPPPANRTIAEVERSLALSVNTYLRLNEPHKRAKIRRQQNVLLDRWLLIEKKGLR